MTDDEGWADPDDQMGVWEHQGEPLTVEALRTELANLDPDTLVIIEHYDGAGGVRPLRPMHIDLRTRPHPAAVVITVVE